jgi:hypothetical protein
MTLSISLRHCEERSDERIEADPRLEHQVKFARFQCGAQILLQRMPRASLLLHHGLKRLSLRTVTGGGALQLPRRQTTWC